MGLLVGVCMYILDLSCTLPDQYIQRDVHYYVNPAGFKLRSSVSLCDIHQPKGQRVYTGKVLLRGEGNILVDIKYCGTMY